jgi:hypothetical protein
MELPDRGLRNPAEWPHGGNDRGKEEDRIRPAEAGESDQT